LKVLTKIKKAFFTIAGIAIDILIRAIPDTKILVQGPPLFRSNLNVLAFDVLAGEIFAWSLYIEHS
jgi:hypothetical protein